MSKINILRIVKKFLTEYIFFKHGVYICEINKKLIKLNSKNILNHNVLNWALKQNDNKGLKDKNFIYEKFQTSCIIKYLNNHRCESFIDIGSQIGYYGLLANCFDNIKNIVFVDIIKKAISTCKKNVDLNFNNKNYYFFNKAIGKGIINYNFFYSSNKVKGIDLGYIISQSNISLTQNDIIKIDIEGYEHSFFDTIEPYLAKVFPVIFFSLHTSFIKNLSDNHKFKSILDYLFHNYKNLYFLNENKNMLQKINKYQELKFLENYKYPVLIADNISLNQTNQN
jgi:hypothetical protein